MYKWTKHQPSPYNKLRDFNTKVTAIEEKVKNLTASLATSYFMQRQEEFFYVEKTTNLTEINNDRNGPLLHPTPILSLFYGNTTDLYIKLGTRLE